MALIEREFGVGKVAFLVTDYVTQPHIVVNPDPAFQRRCYDRYAL